MQKGDLTRASILERAVHWDDDPNSRVNPVKDFIKVVREWITIRSNLRRDIYGLTGQLVSDSGPAL